MGEWFALLARYISQPSTGPSPFLWGDEAIVRERLREGIAELQLTPRLYPAHYPFSVPDFVEFTLRYDPLHYWTFTALEPSQQAQVRREMEHLYTKHNCATDDTTSFAWECLEVIAVRG